MWIIGVVVSVVLVLLLLSWAAGAELVRHDR
jgi:hypothetical protein